MDNSNTGNCPLCNGDNHCAVAAGNPPENCWCQTTTIAPEALAALPVADRGVRCICPHCAKDAGGTHIER